MATGSPKPSTTETTTSITATPEQTPIRRLIDGYRRQYSKMPPGLQLVGLQLWLPLAFIVMFCFCYLVAFHHPQIHDAPVGVVGDAAAVSQLQQATGGSFEYTRFATDAAGEEAVTEGAVIGLLDLQDADAPTLYYASAHQYQAATIVQQAFTPIFAAGGQTLATEDLKPLPEHDSFGMVTMYIMLAFCIGGYMVAMFLGMMGGPLLHRTRFAVIAGGAVVVSLLANTLAGPVIGAVEGHFWQMFLIAAGWIFAIGLAVNGLSYYFGRFITLPAILIFVFLSIPASGAAYPVWMLPSFFGAIQHGVVGFGMTEMIKRTLYGVGEPYWVGLVQMAVYAVVGLLLAFIGKPWRERREARRILAGRTTMMADAQNANRDHHIEIRERILAQRGVTKELVERDEEGGSESDPFLNSGLPLDAARPRTAAVPVQRVRR
jgi:hypothetical protein